MDIENGIPIPPKDDGDARISWPFKRMLVGQSVSVTSDKRTRAKNALRSYSRMTGREFRIAAEPMGAIRIWRVT